MTLTDESLSQLFDFHLLLRNNGEEVLDGGVRPLLVSCYLRAPLGLLRLVELRHELSLVALGGLVILIWRALARLLSLVPHRLLDLRLGKLRYLLLGRVVWVFARVLEVVDVVTSVDLNVCVIVGLLLLLFNGAGGPSVDGVLPALVKVRVFATDVVVQNWRLLYLLQTAS